MAKQVTGSKKNTDGDITGLCGSGWSHTKSEVVTNIQSGRESYYVSVNGRQVMVGARIRNGAYYLTTAPDGYKPNNLDDLRDC
ncbi:DUF3892 domain-containing protein [Microbacterium paludicola]|uniref:DUF3892 domain-containing protein n=1 Tax=Microbacterium paludicola TaxID=300019 RepID=UPI0009037A52|nr:DUF3892 domain-containing protein [Microbacterium paludicola]APF32858.1 hypothetical protein BO218_00475 [Microbacterium paludicola]